MLVSIVSVFHTFGKDLPELLNSIKTLDFPKNQLELILVNNGAKENQIKKIFPEAQIITLNKNYGAPHALNIGFKKAKGKYILKCDNDIIFKKETLTCLLSYLQNNPKTAIVGPKNYFKQPAGKIAPAAQKFNPWLGTLSAYGDLDQTLNPDYIQGSCFLFSKTLFSKIGYLDEGYGLWLFDDQDFCFRAKKAGFDVTYFPKAQIFHSTLKIASARPKIKLDQWYKNKLRFIIKNTNILQNFTSISLQLLSIPYYALFYKDGTSQAIIRGFVWNFKNINKTLIARKQNK